MMEGSLANHMHLKHLTPMPSAIPDPAILGIMHWNEQQLTGWNHHPLVLMSLMLRVKGTEGRRLKGGGGGRKVSQVMRCRRALLSSLLPETKNTHTHTHPAHAHKQSYQFFCRPMREWEEGKKEGSDKERGRWEGVCRKPASLRGRGKEGGGRMDGRSFMMGPWYSLLTDAAFFSTMALSQLCAASPGGTAGARGSTQPGSRRWISPNKEPLRWQRVLLPGGRNASGFPRQAAACSGLWLESQSFLVSVCVSEGERRMDLLCVCIWVWM